MPIISHSVVLQLSWNKLTSITDGQLCPINKIKTSEWI